METQLRVRDLEFLRAHLGMNGCFGVERHGHGGGLALLWDASLVVQIKSYSTYHIDAEVELLTGLRWRFTGFYGNPEVALRSRSWELLRQLNATSDLPWLIMGDFNEIMILEEQMGRLDRNLQQMASFREAILDCSLHDLGFQGPEFTWTNRRDAGDLVRAQLDRGLATWEWSCFQIFKKSKTAQVTSKPTTCQNFWKKSAVIPSGPGALEGDIWNKANLTSSLEKGWSNLPFILGDTTVSTCCTTSSMVAGLVVAKSELK